MKNVVLLGATGSIGTQTLDVIRRLPDRLRVIGLSAFKNQEKLYEIAADFNVPLNRVEIGSNTDLVRLATLPDADIVVVAVAGASGTRATIAALEAGKDVAIATKEILVAAGELVIEASRNSGANVLPIDSEHSAIMQCLNGRSSSEVKTIWLTASGGPFRTWTMKEMAYASLADTLNHPTWPAMGRKVTVDSATMMNKALETIEAQWLFGVEAKSVKVIIHPQSVIHSLVEFVDGALLAQLGLPDMRLPIEYALLFPERVDAGLPKLDLTTLSEPLSFEPPDHAKFPSLDLAGQASVTGGTMPAVLNAANEIAVDFFLNDNIPFLSITSLVENVMEMHRPIQHPTLDQIMSADQWSRDITAKLVSNVRIVQPGAF